MRGTNAEKRSVVETKADYTVKKAERQNIRGTGIDARSTGHEKEVTHCAHKMVNSYTGEEHSIRVEGVHRLCVCVCVRDFRSSDNFSTSLYAICGLRMPDS